MTGLQGRVAFVSGESRGIGRAIAVGLAADGADVAISYRRDEQAAAETVAEIETLGRRARAYAGDVSSHDDNRVVAEATLADLGPVDLLVHNAGGAFWGNDVVRADPDEMGRLFDTHAFGGWSLAHLFLPTMRERPRGDVALVSSGAVLLAPRLPLFGRLQAVHPAGHGGHRRPGWSLPRRHVSHGHNLHGIGCPILAPFGLPVPGGDRNVPDPMLGSPTRSFPPTLKLDLGSPAVDAGDDAACPATDAPGVLRPLDGDGDSIATCDIGAFELAP